MSPRWRRKEPFRKGEGKEGDFLPQGRGFRGVKGGVSDKRTEDSFGHRPVKWKKGRDQEERWLAPLGESSERGGAPVRNIPESEESNGRGERGKIEGLPIRSGRGETDQGAKGSCLSC